MHICAWPTPGQRVICPDDFVVVEHPDNEQVEMQPLDQLPSKSTQQKIVEEHCDGGAQPIWTGNTVAVNTNQEEKLAQTEGQGKLTMDQVQLTLHPDMNRVHAYYIPSSRSNLNMTCLLEREQEHYCYYKSHNGYAKSHFGGNQQRVADRLCICREVP